MNTSSIKTALNTLHPLKTPAGYSKIYSRYRDQINRMDIESLEKEKLLEQIFTALDEYFVPSMNKLYDTLLDALSLPNKESGVWYYPDGDEYYKYALKMNTTLDLNPEELHEFGKIEVEKIRKRIAEVRIRLGKNTSIETDESILDHMDDLFYPEFQPEYPSEHLLEMVRYLISMYSFPKTDSKSKKSFYCYDSYDEIMKENTIYFHELIPGHHLERSYNLKMNNIPMIKHFCFFTAYIEGWALYSERLAFETLTEEKDKRELDFLQFLLLRAKRIVADTGINFKGWSRRETVNYMLEDGVSKKLAEDDVDRYITIPGQACAYYLGYLKIMELRDLMKEKYGDKFNLKDFHKLILENGQMPLEILERKFMESI